MSAVPPPGLVVPDAWFVACATDELRGKPLARTIQGKPLVLFRGTKNVATALLDRCPHRNVPLSMGKVVGQQLECAYHGWKFDHSGACVTVPGLMEQDASLKSRCAEHYATRELDGFVWVYSTPNVEPKNEPFRFPHLNDAGYSTVRRQFVVEAGLHASIENTLDVPHTSFLHGGLFRTAEKKNVIDVVVRRHANHAEAEFIGEPAPRGLAGRILAPGGGVVQHFDRFFLPCIAQVEYRLGARSHLMTTTAFTPESDDFTRVYAVVTFKLPVPGWLVRPFVAPVATRIFAQDRVVLARQREQVKRFGGEKFTSTELDVLGPQVTLLLKHAANGTTPDAHEHRLQMRT
ncbi:MAG: aromatic ring-hydroxylating dioxygenase subunit alpha [Archangium sp.]|nr:aromatic ring-hydroxylating dioxygenase subunit alpha [Archangium sp.]